MLNNVLLVGGDLERFILRYSLCLPHDRPLKSLSSTEFPVLLGPPGIRFGFAKTSGRKNTRVREIIIHFRFFFFVLKPRSENCLTVRGGNRFTVIASIPREFRYKNRCTFFFFLSPPYNRKICYEFIFVIRSRRLRDRAPFKHTNYTFGRLKPIFFFRTAECRTIFGSDTFFLPRENDRLTTNYRKTIDSSAPHNACERIVRIGIRKRHRPPRGILLYRPRDM